MKKVFIDLNDIKLDLIKHVNEYKEYEKLQYNYKRNSIKNPKTFPPQCNNKICKYLYRVVVNYSHSWKCDSETKNDMVQFALERCLRYAHNVDVDRDVFSYFTQVIKTAFCYFLKNGESRNEKIIESYIQNIVSGC